MLSIEGTTKVKLYKNYFDILTGIFAFYNWGKSMALRSGNSMEY